MKLNPAPTKALSSSIDRFSSIVQPKTFPAEAKWGDFQARTAEHTQFHPGAPYLRLLGSLSGGSKLASTRRARRAAPSADSRQTDLEQMEPRHRVNLRVSRPKAGQIAHPCAPQGPWGEWPVARRPLPLRRGRRTLTSSTPHGGGPAGRVRRLCRVERPAWVARQSGNMGTRRQRRPQ